MLGSARRKTYDTSTDPSRGCIRREVASALGFLVILFNLIAGPLLSSSAGAMGSPIFDEIFGDRIVICTGAGRIVLDAQGNRVPVTGGVEAMCVFCLPLVAGGADAPVAVAVPDAPAVFERATRLVATLVVPVATRPLASASPRGPPLA